MSKECPYENLNYLCPYDRCNTAMVNCDAYKLIEQLMSRQQFRGRVHKRIYRGEHGHKQYEESPDFTNNQDIALLVRALVENETKGVEIR